MTEFSYICFLAWIFRPVWLRLSVLADLYRFRRVPGEKLKNRQRRSYAVLVFFCPTVIHVALTQNARDDRVYLRKRVSTGYFRVEFSSAGGTCALGNCVLRTCTYIRLACMPRVVDFSKRCAARTFLSACSHMCVYVCPAPNDDLSLFASTVIRSRGMRVAIACMCTRSM